MRKLVWREKLEAMPEADVFLRRADGSLEAVAFGESDGFSTAAGLDVTQDSADHDSPEASDSLPKFVGNGLKMIAEDPEYAQPGAEIKVVCPIGKTAPVFSLPVVIDEDGEIASKLLFAAETGAVRQRRACFVEVDQGTNREKCLLIVEGRTRLDGLEILVSPKNAIINAVILLLVA